MRIFHHINSNSNLGKIRRKHYDITLLGKNNYFPSAEIMRLQKTTMDLNLKDNFEKIILEEKIRNFYKNNRLDLIDCEKDYVNSFVDYEKYDLLNELSEKVPVSNGSRYYKKYDIDVGIICDEFLFNLYKDCCNLFYELSFDSFFSV